MSQIALPFDWPADEERSDFIVTASNERAITHLDHWGSWPVSATILTGPRKSGRSLLGRIFVAKSGAILIDDAESKREDSIFHAWNLAQEAHVPLLIIADHAPPLWQVRLADLRSRLAATPVITIDPPDDILMQLLLVKLLGRRGIGISPDVVDYVVNRVDRNHIGLMRIVDTLDEASLSQRRAMTVPFVREALGHSGLLDTGTWADGEEAGGVTTTN